MSFGAKSRNLLSVNTKLKIKSYQPVGTTIAFALQSPMRSVHRRVESERATHPPNQNVTILKFYWVFSIVASTK